MLIQVERWINSILSIHHSESRGSQGCNFKYWGIPFILLENLKDHNLKKRVIYLILRKKLDLVTCSLGENILEWWASGSTFVFWGLVPACYPYEGYVDGILINLYPTKDLQRVTELIRIDQDIPDTLEARAQRHLHQPSTYIYVVGLSLLGLRLPI